jgi:hypothetical protein
MGQEILLFGTAMACVKPWRSLQALDQGQEPEASGDVSRERRFRQISGPALTLSKDLGV